MNCHICAGNVSANFNYFCRYCYRIYVRQYPITNIDFLNYIENSFNIQFEYIPDKYRFPDIRTSLLIHYPSIISLANMLENILFLKLLLINRRNIYLKSCFK